MPSLRRFLLRRCRLVAPFFYRYGLLLLLLLLLCDGISALCFPQIQAALSSNPSPTPATHVRIAALANNSGVRVLASDTFQRSNQSRWGTASDGHTWQTEPGGATNFVILDHVGVIESTPTRIYCNALLGPRTANAEITFNAALSQYGPSLLGAVLRWSDANNFYELTLNGQELAFDRVMDGMQIPLQSVPFPARANAFYTFRLRVVGVQLFAMVWPTGQPAPANWQLTASDSALSSGRVGLRVVVQNSAQARITAFKEVQL